MRLPKRRSDRLRSHADKDEVIYLTPEGKEKLERTLYDFETRHEPQAIRDVAKAVEKGDLRENAEYQEARPRLTRIQNRILAIREQLKRVEVIEHDGSDTVQIGSTVTVKIDKKQKTFRIVGPRETDPGKGYISYLSPIGSALMKHKAGDTVSAQVGDTDKKIRIIRIR